MKQESGEVGYFEHGPYLRLATLCERVLEEKDGTWTLVRVVDRFTVTARGPDAPPELQPTQLDVTLVVLLTSGSVRGSHELEIRMEQPSGLTRPLLVSNVHFEGEERGARFMFPGRIGVSDQGLYWFHVLFDGKLLTKVPLRVAYARLAPLRSPSS